MLHLAIEETVHDLYFDSKQITVIVTTKVIL